MRLPIPPIVNFSFNININDITDLFDWADDARYNVAHFCFCWQVDQSGGIGSLFPFPSLANPNFKPLILLRISELPPFFYSILIKYKSIVVTVFAHRCFVCIPSSIDHQIDFLNLLVHLEVSDESFTVRGNCFIGLLSRLEYSGQLRILARQLDIRLPRILMAENLDHFLFVVHN